MNKARIVLIEDNSADVFLVEMALQANSIPYELTRFKNGKDAVSSLCSPLNAFHPDAILLDLNTPKSDGFEVLGKLRQTPHLADVPIAIITSSQATSDKYRTSNNGRGSLYREAFAIGGIPLDGRACGEGYALRLKGTHVNAHTCPPGPGSGAPASHRLRMRSSTEH